MRPFPLLPGLLLFLLQSAFPGVSQAAAPPSDALDRLDNQLLASELTLAGKTQFYMVFDFTRGMVFLKARGKAFREWPIRGFRFWGTGIPLKPLALTDKSTFFSPRRPMIAPAKPAEAGTGEAGEELASTPFEIEALELSDMPGQYTLTLGEGVQVSLAPGSRGLVSWIQHLGHALWWNGTLPLRTLWSRVRGKPLVAIDMEMDKKDAQEIYWAFPEGMNALLYHAGNAFAGNR